MSNRHKATMTLHEGTYEIKCPTCGMVKLIHDEPFQVITINPGDPTADHYGSTGGLEMKINVEAE